MKSVVILLFFIVAINAYSQHVFGPSDIPTKKNIAFVELTGGGILPSMRFKGTPYDTYKSGRFIGQTEGLGIRIQNTKSFSYSALFSYREQGVSFPENGNLLLNANYLNLFVPVEFGINLHDSKKKASPMVLAFAGPYAAYLIKGKATVDGLDFPLTTHEFNVWDAGIEGGFGFRIPTFSLQGRSNLNLKVSYFYGLVNTYPIGGFASSQELNDKLFFSDSGGRFNQGLRITISYEMSLEKKSSDTFVGGGNGKSTYKRFVNIR